MSHSWNNQGIWPGSNNNPHQSQPEEGYSSGGRFLPDQGGNPLGRSTDDETSGKTSDNTWVPDSDLHQNKALGGGYALQDHIMPNQAVTVPQGTIYNEANDHVRSGLANWSGMAGSSFPMGTTPIINDERLAAQFVPSFDGERVHNSIGQSNLPSFNGEHAHNSIGQSNLESSNVDGCQYFSI